MNKCNKYEQQDKVFEDVIAKTTCSIYRLIVRSRCPTPNWGQHVTLLPWNKKVTRQF